MANISLGTARDLWANKPVSATMQNAAVATGNGTDLNVTGYGMALLHVTGTFVGTITFRGSADGINFSDIAAINKSTGLFASTAIAPGLYEIDCRGLQVIRAQVSSYTSGSITVFGIAEPFAGHNPFMQLSGSKPIKIIFDAPITAGSIAEVATISDADMSSGYCHIVGIFMGLSGAKGSLMITYNDNFGNHLVSDIINSGDTDNIFPIDKWVAAGNGGLTIRIRNNEASDYDFKAHIRVLSV